MFTGKGQLLKARAYSFNGSKGEKVDAYEVSLLIDAEPIKMGASKEAFESCTDIEAGTEVNLGISLFTRHDGRREVLKAKVISIEAA